MGMKRKVCCVLAAVFALLGAAMQLVYTAVRFTGFLLWCAGAALVLYALLDLLGERWAWARWCRRLFLSALLLGTLFFTVLEAFVVTNARTVWPEDPEAPDAMVILGAGVNGTEPSLSLLSRLQAALYYIGQENREFPVVVTGSQGPGEEISEAQCMAQWLIEHGVSPSRVLLEEQARTTEENVQYSKALLAEYGADGDAAVAVVTSDYHLCRAKWLWGSGMWPVAAYLPERYWPLTLNYYVREAFGLAALIVF